MSSRNHKTSADYKRIFILGAKELSSADLRAEFERFGTITDIRMLKNGDRENKGLNYITFTKASEAALAIDEMNGRRIRDLSKPIKVVLANDRTEGSVRDPHEDDKMKRLFIMIPQGYDQSTVEKEFEKFGEVEYVKFLRRGQSSVQLAYVKFAKAYHAALALEECDPSYRAIFADTTWSSKRSYSGDRRDYESDSKYRKHDGGSRMYADRYQTMSEEDRYYAEMGLVNPNKASAMFGGSFGGSDCCLEAKMVPHMTQEQVYKLFDVVPGLIYCNYDPNSGMADIRYISQSMASHAREKLNQLEYPLGYPVVVTMSSNQAMDESHGNIQTLVSTIEKATEYLKQSALSGLMGTSGQAGLTYDVSKYCNVTLPSVKPIAPENSQCVDRLFIVSYPTKIPEDVLTDIFCRFGGLISVFYLPNKRCGFAKFTSTESAQEAMRLLHMQNIYGCTLKVIQAEPPGTITRGSYHEHERDDDIGHSSSSSKKSY